MQKYPIALLINDIHVDKNNIADFKLNWNEMLAICKQKQIYDVVIGGDMFTSRASQTLDVLLAVSWAYYKAVKAGLNITVAEGNHDKVDQEKLEGYNHVFKYYPGVKVIDTHEIMQWDDCDYTLLVMSYFPEAGSFEEKLEDAKAALKKNNIDLANTILYIHEGIHGALGNMELTTEVEQEVFEGFKDVLCGHYHNRTVITGTRIEYIGSSRQKDFGEDQDKGYTVLYDDGTFEFIQNQVNTRYLNFETSYNNLKYLDLSEINLDITKVKLKINCTDAEKKLIDKEKLYEMGVSKIDFKTEKTEVAKIAESDINTKYDKEGLKKEYNNFSKQKSLDPELGVKYLEQII